MFPGVNRDARRADAASMAEYSPHLEKIPRGASVR